MKYFSTEWKKLKDEIVGENTFLFLDYDGTLSPIRKRPEEATLKPAVKEIIKELATYDEMNVAIVSGRGLSDVKKMVGINSLVYAGNHGFEIKGPNFHFEEPTAKETKPLLQKIARQLRKKLEPFPDAIVENKKYSLSIHYRLVPFYQMKQLKKDFLETIRPYYQKKEIRVTEGKRVWEVRPPVEWHKGAAIDWIMKKVKGKKRGKFISIYIGDDTTDEDAFKAIKKNGISIRVGKTASSNAKYYLRNPETVHLFLKDYLQTLEALYEDDEE